MQIYLNLNWKWAYKGMFGMFYDLLPWLALISILKHRTTQSCPVCIKTKHKMSIMLWEEAAKPGVKCGQSEIRLGQYEMRKCLSCYGRKQQSLVLSVVSLKSDWDSMR